MNFIHVEMLQRAKLLNTPFRHLVVKDFLKCDSTRTLVSHFPKVAGPGNHRAETVQVDDIFSQFLSELQTTEFRDALSDRFKISLNGLSLKLGIRGWSGSEDGRIHPDMPEKVLSGLIYLNSSWEDPKGQLRLLLSENIDDYFLEIPPHFGTLVVFKRTSTSYHGYLPYVGERRVVQFNWYR